MNHWYYYDAFTAKQMFSQFHRGKGQLDWLAGNLYARIRQWNRSR